jgi:hypothetical protein
MIMSSLFLYILLKLDTIKTILLFGWGSFIYVIFVGLIADMYVDINTTQSEWYSIVKKFRPYLICTLGVIIVIISYLIPSSKEMAIIFVVPKVVNNETIQKIPQKILKLGDDWLDELSPDKILGDDVKSKISE